MKKNSLLARKEEARSIRQTILYGGLAIILVLGIIFGGIPALIKMAVFLGNLRTSSLPIETKDTIPPNPPVLVSLPEATNSAQLNFSGFAEPSSMVEIFLGGISVRQTVVGNDGIFNIDNLSLTLGKNEIYTIATDEAGNKSSESEKIIVWYDNVLPELEIVKPEDKTTWENNRVEIVGKTKPEVTILINNHLVIVDREGNFNYPLSLSLGENAIKVIATDRAGNQTEKSLTLTYSP
jgi:hypothetical protein